MVLVELMPLSVRSSPLAWCAPLAGASEGEATSVADDAVPTREDLDGMVVGLEAGCGCGSAAFPLLRANPELFILATDFSAEAIGLLRGRDEYVRQSALRPRRIFAWVSDIAAPAGGSVSFSARGGGVLRAGAPDASSAGLLCARARGRFERAQLWSSNVSMKSRPLQSLTA